MGERLKRILLIIAGLFFVGLGGLGALLPGLPTTPFLLLAAGCFAHSSPRLHGWLLGNPLFGPLIRNWQQHRAIPRRARRMALIMIALVGGLSIYLAPSNALRLLIASLLVIPVVILLRLRLLDELSVEEGGDNLSLATDGSNPAHTERFKSATITGNRNQQGIDHDGAAQPPNP